MNRHEQCMERNQETGEERPESMWVDGMWIDNLERFGARVDLYLGPRARSAT